MVRNRQTARRLAKTTERGLGNEHQKLRRQLLPLAYGKECPKCGRVMLKGQPLDLDHSVPRALGGIGGECRMTHRRCNRADGARLGNRMRAQRTRVVRSRW